MSNDKTPDTMPHYTPDQTDRFFQPDGKTSTDGQKSFGNWERDTNYQGDQAPQMPHETWDDFQNRTNK